MQITYKRGQVVTIYEDPKTELIVEGKAVLLKKSSTEMGNLEGWTVSFEGDDSTVFRWIKKK